MSHLKCESARRHFQDGEGKKALPSAWLWKLSEGSFTSLLSIGHTHSHTICMMPATGSKSGHHQQFYGQWSCNMEREVQGIELEETQAACSRNRRIEYHIITCSIKSSSIPEDCMNYWLRQSSYESYQHVITPLGGCVAVPLFPRPDTHLQLRWGQVTPVSTDPDLIGECHSVTADIGSLFLVPQIDPSVKLYNHGEGPC